MMTGRHANHDFQSLQFGGSLGGDGKRFSLIHPSPVPRARMLAAKHASMNPITQGRSACENHCAVARMPPINTPANAVETVRFIASPSCAGLEGEEIVRCALNILVAVSVQEGSTARRTHDPRNRFPLCRGGRWVKLVGAFAKSIGLVL